MGELRLYPGRAQCQLTAHEQVYKDGTLIIESWNIQSVSTQCYGMGATFEKGVEPHPREYRERRAAGRSRVADGVVTGVDDGEKKA